MTFLAWAKIQDFGVNTNKILNKFINLKINFDLIFRINSGLAQGQKNKKPWGNF
jgi:hypothetical protein